MAVPTVLVMTFTMFHAHTHMLTGPVTAVTFAGAGPQTGRRGPQEPQAAIVLSPRKPASLCQTCFSVCFLFHASNACVCVWGGAAPLPILLLPPIHPHLFLLSPPYFPAPPPVICKAPRRDGPYLFRGPLGEAPAKAGTERKTRTMRTSPKQQEQQRDPAFFPQTEPTFLMSLNKLPITR